MPEKCSERFYTDHTFKETKDVVILEAVLTAIGLQVNVSSS